MAVQATVFKIKDDFDLCLTTLAGERSYHIFYALLRGSAEAERETCWLNTTEPCNYGYLRPGQLGEAGGGRNDKQLFHDVRIALQAVGLSSQALEQMWQLVAGVLHLGSIVFDSAKTECATVMPSSQTSLKCCEGVLGIQARMLQKALCKRKIKAGKEFVEQDLRVGVASDCRDALSRALYSRMFEYMVAQINRALETDGTDCHEVESRVIGIVDIFGFEVFNENSLEQL